MPDKLRDALCELEALTHATAELAMVLGASKQIERLQQLANASERLARQVRELAESL